ncbi:MAG: hypothetical protein DSY33_01705 [Archaeoglobus sp.]|nr:MAG: hypothetical protein DSY33_01705 [Archaeoglobus sp.]
MEIVPVAFDSFGVRSMATFIKSETSIFIDPGVALGPKRYGLPPHPLEFEAEKKFWHRVKEKVRACEVIVITHYHYDHYNPRDIEFLKGKTLLVKHPTENINRSQKRRASYFLSQINSICNVEYADGKTFEFNGVNLKFSNPVFHGTSSKLGYVVEVLVDDGNEKFLFSSDVEGPSLKNQLEFMIKSNAETVFIDGPMTYMLGYRYSSASLEASINNLIELIRRTDVKKLVLDHHLLRDLEWRKKVSKVIETGKDAGVCVCSAAEFAGYEENLLEARRKELYKEFPL